jgi:surfactin synthase thioesterase subunit
MNHLPPQIDLWAVQPPGRGNRLNEHCLTRLTELVSALSSELPPYLDRPFILFGHSLGALASFELIRHLRRQGLPLPQVLIVSGQGAPQLPNPNPLLHRMPEHELIQMLRQYGGTPEAVLREADLLQLLLPSLRADFEMLETYTYQPEDPLDCPIVVLGGQSDPRVPIPDLQAWREQTSASFSSQLFPGGHFFLLEQQQLFLPTFSDLLQTYF